MSKKSNFSRLDERVFFTMGALCLLSLVVMAFRFATHKPCAPVKLTLKTTNPVAGNTVRFEAVTTDGKSFSWDFGDRTIKEEEISSINHVFTLPGTYPVSVVVNGECSDMLTVVVADAPHVVNTSLQPIIAADPADTVYVNTPVHFSDISTAGKTWAWRFGETTLVDATGQNAVWVYNTPGRKTVRLTINDRNDLTVSYSILVLEKPVEKALPKPRPLPVTPLPTVTLPSKPNSDPLKPPATTDAPKKEEPKEKPKGPAVTPDMLKQMLLQVVQGQKKAEDFSEYLGGNLSIQVTFNDDVMPFTQMCEKLKTYNYKKIKELNVNPVINSENNHVLSMTVVLKKKWLPL